MIQAYFGFKKVPFTKDLKTEQMFQSFDLKEAGTRLLLSDNQFWTFF